MRGNPRTQLLTSLAKLSDNQTVCVGQLECRRLFKDIEPSLVVSTIIESGCRSRESIKICVQLAQDIGTALQGHISQLICFLIKKLKDSDPGSCLVLAETIGSIVQHVVVESTQLQSILKTVMIHLEKNSQHALCLTRIVQFMPVHLLDENAAFLMKSLLQILNLPLGKLESLEGIAALILSLEPLAEQFADQVLPILGPLLHNSNWQIRKMALDVLYSLSVLAPQKITLKFRELSLSLKSDKIKKVREAAILVINLFDQISQQPSHRSEQFQINPVAIPRTESSQSLQPQINRQDTREDKLAQLDIVVEALNRLTQLLEDKGLLDSVDLQPVTQLLGSLKEQPIGTNRLKNSAVEEQTFISKEAQEILKEFRDRS